MKIIDKFGSKISLILGIVVLIFFAVPHHIVNAESDKYTQAVMYFNRACSGCSDYLDRELKEILVEFEFTDIEYRDYISNTDYRSELNELSKELEIPFDLQSHIMVFVGDNIVDEDDVNAENVRVILGGHIPTDMTRFLLQKDALNEGERIIVYQDKMPNMEIVDNYKAWMFSGEITEYGIDEPIETFIDWFRSTAHEGSSNVFKDSWNWQNLLPTVLITGFLDGLNPCAIAVLLFFVSYLFTIKKARLGIVKMGIVYILAIYLAYLLIGIGLLKAVLITGVPHFMAWVGAILVIGLGVLNLANYFFPKFPVKFKIPDFSKGAIQDYMYKATLPAAFVLGFVVGLCTFPCSGGPYVAIILLLSTQASSAVGFVYLLLYNVMFVLPLIVLLILAGNKYATEKLLEWESSKARKLSLISGLIMIVLGLIIIFFFI
ncbi:MAG: cytochrome c biogenesis CcdA family protein [Candidatus Dojkabacteria bacterium]